MNFIDLQAQYGAYREEIDTNIREVLESSRYINGPQIAELESALASFVGARHAIGLSSGTTALRLALMAWGIGPGDEVITTPFTFFATAEVIALAGAKPCFVDIDPETFNMDPAKLEAAITPATKAVLPVSLYGQSADFDTINAICKKHQLHCLDDACQALGSAVNGKRNGTLTEATAISFFPSKPLGCYGDGGMLFTSDSALAEQVRTLREHGQSGRYRHVTMGMNARLDTIQAAILLAKLPHFENEIKARQDVAAGYAERLQGVVKTPQVKPGNLSVYAQYTIRVEQRERFQQRMTEAGVPTAVHYPVVLHEQPVFADLPYSNGDFPLAEQAAKEVISLPMHPFMSDADLDRVAAAVKAAV